MNVAFIPVRGGSKSIPLKNIKELNGRPLVYWTVSAASKCPEIDKVYVATDSERIKETVVSFHLPKVEVIGRSEASATDTASTESAMVEFATSQEFDNIVLIQATSPLLIAEDLSRGFELFYQKGTDSVLSAVKQKRFIWQETDEKAEAQNYDIFNRPRRQDYDGYYVENGAFYITSREALLRTGNRISGTIRIADMPEDTFYEIDEPSDWMIIRELMNKRSEERREDHFPDIKLVLTDSDGCLTDGGMYYTESGDELKKFNAVDGMGFRILREKGILTGIITGEERDLIKRRAEKIKVDFLEMNAKNKLELVQKICDDNGITLKNVAYIGDDVNDLELLEKVGLPCSVANAMEDVKEHARYVSARRGGDGAVREIIDYIINNLGIK